MVAIINGESQESQFETSIAETIKMHRTTIQNGSTANAWTDCDTFTVIADETQGGIATLNVDGKTLEILKDGLYQFGGCLHVQNNTAGVFSGITVLSRLVQDGTEMRCSQRGYVINIAAGGEDVLSYNGTAALAAGEEVKLQYYTDNTNVDFFSDSNFDNAVAYTLWLIRVGELE